MSNSEMEDTITEPTWKRVRLDRLRLNPDNINSMDSRIVVRLRHALDKWGFVQNLVVTPSKKYPGQYIVIGGNHRIEVLQAKKKPPKRVMCCIVPHMRKAERALLSQALNRIQGSDNREDARTLYESLIGTLGPDVMDEILGHQTAVQKLIHESDFATDEEPDDVEEQDGEEEPGVIRVKAKPNTIHHGNCLKMKFPNHCFDSIVTDPPYQINIFERGWDSSQDLYNFTLDWVTRHLHSLKPGGYICCFINTRQYDLMVRAFRECKLIVRDPLVWVRYISKIPGKRLNKKGTVYTTMKNCCEFIAVGQKPPVGTFRENYEKYGVGGFFFDDAIIPYIDEEDREKARKLGDSILTRARAGLIGGRGHRALQGNTKGWIRLDGRRPSNVIVLPDEAEVMPENYQPYFVIPTVRHGSREAVKHETQKPLALTEWVVKLVTPISGLCADLFGGSGTTGIACLQNKRKFLLVELKKRYYTQACERLEIVSD